MVTEHVDREGDEERAFSAQPIRRPPEEGAPPTAPDEIEALPPSLPTWVSLSGAYRVRSAPLR